MTLLQFGKRIWHPIGGLKLMRGALSLTVSISDPAMAGDHEDADGGAGKER